MVAPLPPAGWYPDPSGQGQRYFDGTQWTEHRSTSLSEQQRSAILQRALVEYVGSNSRVAAQSPTSATLIVGQPPNHVAHLLATIFLCGLWLPIWAIIAATNQPKRFTVSVDEQGQVHWSGPGIKATPTAITQYPTML
jgi:hypothetical protein